MLRKLLLLFILCFISCKKNIKSQVIETANISDVERLGYALEKALDSDDIFGINKLYDERALANRFLQKSSKKRILQFNSGYFKSFSRQFSFGEMIISEKSNGAYYDFINVYLDENNNYHLIFRLYNNGINYHDHLIKVVNGKPKIIDTYIYLSGEFLSDSYKRMYKRMLNKVIFDNKNLDEITFIKDLEKLKEVRSLILKQNFKKALNKYNSISNASKKLKSFKIININASSNISEKLYIESIEDYKKSFPKDKSLPLISIDGYIINKQFNKAFQNIDILDRYVKGDKLLNFIRGNTFIYQKKIKEALEMFTTVNKDFPKFIDAYESKLMIYLEQHNHEKAIEILDVLNNDFKTNKEDITLNIANNYPNFIKSKAYENWYKSK
ncbi:hypothetical protein OD91_0350 [Lutibacter sp. Hel_I_33_5]|uniref:tetratricopeptide repeat protein n=1 Tax=Lutibacter sp. Hel_I_33_5 TaxID=1566289 RepID=UPI0011A60C7B|nr:tetratricopeptide repeat protein [Lutibacter sp. Hel_I_33_5]TVZ55108.1 hypothetical protein OD91_0350 [Lutibacter sp. Hel_I_33_5]